MRRAIPVIHEHVADLKQRLQRERDGRKPLRLQMVYLLASTQVQARQAIAHLLGVSRNTVGHWRADDERGGLDGLLTVYVPPGKQPSLAPEVLASIEALLHQPHGFESYYDLRAWVEHTHGVAVKTKTRYTIVCQRSKTKLKVPRPSHKKRLRR